MEIGIANGNSPARKIAAARLLLSLPIFTSEGTISRQSLASAVEHDPLYIILQSRKWPNSCTTRAPSATGCWLWSMACRTTCHRTTVRGLWFHVETSTEGSQVSIICRWNCKWKHDFSQEARQWWNCQKQLLDKWIAYRLIQSVCTLHICTYDAS